MSKYAIELKNLTKFFNLKHSESFSKKISSKDNINEHSLKVLNNISFAISQGESVAIIGLNGQGKTTLLRTISGIYPPTSGSVVTNGKIAPLLQIGTGFNNELNAKENIVTYGMLLGLTKSEITSKVDEIIRFAELQNFELLKLKYYSSGMRTRLAFSTAVQVNPDIILIDESLSVGDLSFRDKSFNKIIDLKKANKTIIFTSHNLQTVSYLASRVLLLHKGELVFDGDAQIAIEKFKKISKNVSQ